ncbi:MAG: hypothetical protein AB7S48_17195 [Bacteroidales bacterium]
METKLMFSNESQNFEQRTDIPFIPRINEWVINTNNILKPMEMLEIKQSSRYWPGIKSVAQSVEYQHADNEFYVEVYIRCEVLSYNKILA